MYINKSLLQKTLLITLFSLLTKNQAVVPKEESSNNGFEEENKLIMKEFLNQKKFITNEEQQKIINDFALNEDTKDAEELEELTRLNLEYLKEHYKGQNVEILPPKYQYFKKSKTGKVVPISDVTEIRKAFAKNEKDEEVTIPVKSTSNLSEEIGKKILKQAEEINKLTSPEALKNQNKKEVSQPTLKVPDFKSKLNEKINSFDITKNLQILEELKKSNEMLQKQLQIKASSDQPSGKNKNKKEETIKIPQSKNLTFKIENEDLKMPALENRILKSTLEQQNQSFFKDIEIKKGNILDFVPISEKEYLKSISENEQLKQIEKENQEAIDLAAELIESEIDKSIKDAEYDIESSEVPSLITSKSRAEIERIKNQKTTPTLEKKEETTNKDTKVMTENTNIKNLIIEKNKQIAEIEKKLLEKYKRKQQNKNIPNPNKDVIEIKSNTQSLPTVLLKTNDEIKSKDQILNIQIEEMNKKFEEELAKIEEDRLNRLKNISNKEKLMMETLKVPKNVIENKVNLLERNNNITNQLEDQVLKIQNLEIEKLKNRLEENKKTETIIQNQLKEYNKIIDKEYNDWEKKMSDEKQKIDEQRKNNLEKEKEITKIYFKKPTEEVFNEKQIELKNTRDVIKDNLKKITEEKVNLENQLRQTNSDLMNSNKKLTKEDMKFFMDKIQELITEIRKKTLEIEKEKSKNLEFLEKEINNTTDNNKDKNNEIAVK
jgi:hypothetical protein